MSEQRKHLYEFNSFRLDPTERLLLRNGKSVPLTLKAFDLLLVLVQHSGHLLEKDELMRKVWPDVTVEEANLAYTISLLRKTLGESPKEPKCIETIPKRGYRFVAAVREIGSEGAHLKPEEHAQSHVASEKEEPLDTPRHNLPRQLTSFIGREREMAEIQRLLSTTCLLTLTGSGGCGKTRLALQVAAGRVEEYPDGVWLVDLAPVADPLLVPQAVASVVGVRDAPGRSLTETLAGYLHSKSVLLLLDNCEHVIEACAQLAETLLRACPRLRILATSREALGIAGETAWRVPSLSLPDRHHLPPIEALTHYEAVRLFTERATAALPTFTVSQPKAAAVVQVCQRLDGIPLAIELASAYVQALPVEQIATHLEDRFYRVTGGRRTALRRHQTLWATIDWSYNLLTEPERWLLGRLSVFAGGWTLEAAEAVCSGEGLDEFEVMDLLSHLVNKSLVVYEEQGVEPRYRLLEMVRQYSRGTLKPEEAATLRDRHRDYFLRLAERAEPKLLAAEQVEWLERLDRELDNLRLALEWSQAEERGAEAGLRLAGASWRFWMIRSYLTEGRGWLERGLQKSHAVAAVMRTKALTGAGALAYLQGDYVWATRRLEESLALAQEVGDEWNMACSMNFLGLLAKYQGDHERARALFEEALATSEKGGGKWNAAFGHHGLATQAYMLGDNVRSLALFEALPPLFREVGDRWLRGYSLTIEGRTMHRLGRYERAAALYEEGLADHRQVGNKRGIAGLLEGLAGVWVVRGQPERAARLLGAMEVLREAINAPVPSVTRPDHARDVAAVRAALGEEAFVAAWAEGRAMTEEQAIAYALNEPAM